MTNKDEDFSNYEAEFYEFFEAADIRISIYWESYGLKLNISRVMRFNSFCAGSEIYTSCTPLNYIKILRIFYSIKS